MTARKRRDLLAAKPRTVTHHDYEPMLAYYRWGLLCPRAGACRPLRKDPLSAAVPLAISAGTDEEPPNSGAECCVVGGTWAKFERPFRAAHIRLQPGEWGTRYGRLRLVAHSARFCARELTHVLASFRAAS